MARREQQRARRKHKRYSARSGKYWRVQAYWRRGAGKNKTKLVRREKRRRRVLPALLFLRLGVRGGRRRDGRLRLWRLRAGDDGHSADVAAGGGLARASPATHHLRWLLARLNDVIFRRSRQRGWRWILHINRTFRNDGERCSKRRGAARWASRQTACVSAATALPLSCRWRSVGGTCGAGLFPPPFCWRVLVKRRWR